MREGYCKKLRRRGHFLRGLLGPVEKCPLSILCDSYRSSKDAVSDILTCGAPIFLGAKAMSGRSRKHTKGKLTLFIVVETTFLFGAALLPGWSTLLLVLAAQGSLWFPGDFIKYD